MQFAFEGMYSLLSGISSLYQKKRLLRGEDQRIRRNSLRIRIGSHQCWTSAYQKTKLLRGEVQRIRRGFAEDS